MLERVTGAHRSSARLPEASGLAGSSHWPVGWPGWCRHSQMTKPARRAGSPQTLPTWTRKTRGDERG